jgi:hypothetical protein
MNVEIGTDAAQFPGKEYINGFSLQCTETVDLRLPEKKLTYCGDPEPSLRFLVKNHLSNILTYPPFKHKSSPFPPARQKAGQTAI